MEVHVRLFAVLREAAGASEVSVELEDDSDVPTLLEQIQLQHPALADRCDGTVVAINEEYAESDARVHEGDDIALIPPVSGGAVSERINVGVTTEVLNPSEIADTVRQATNGAVVIFEGVVRNNNQGRDVLFLEYEAYPDMAEKILHRIGREALDDFQIGDIALWHRTGRLEIGETSLVIVVGSPHRREGFAACLEAVEKVKALVPVWKHEVWDGGSEWLRGAG